ncbi:MAG: hypothetical protein WBA13_01295 [Microcoleaceae cyanobacterium]
MQVCPVCEGQRNIRVKGKIERCSLCEGFGQIGEVQLRRYLVAVDLAKQQTPNRSS